MRNFDEPDLFTDESLIDDPQPHYDRMRGECPVRIEPHHGVAAVTGYEQAVEVFRDHAGYSSINAVTGPFPSLPFEPEGDDIGALIEKYRDHFPMNEHLVTLDRPQHTAHRELLKKLLTPRRLKENEEFVRRLADRQIDEFLERGRCELMSEYAKPFSLLVIADLLGVPEEDHRSFRAQLASGSAPLENGEVPIANPLEFLEERFTRYVEDRRREPRGDVLTSLATARFPDGTLPEVADVVRVACFLFAAGQDTTARLLTSAFRIIAERPDLQRLLRDERERVPAFVEETLRMESPVKSGFRLARTPMTLGGVDVAPGTTVMVLNGAVNRDPARFECPHEFRVDRPNVREHLAFGRGIHTCPGGPLARIEALVSIERLLDRTSGITLSEAEHGPPGERRYSYEPTYILRGLNELHLEFAPAAAL
ncbi:cytochrome P450 [Actinomadura sp. WMMB 499]|uniref:cytochrome P450 n=1 Tax=Actinomadura sp. WMMB 499 TaxID=1219491 RepID=UPI001244102F|nr:cytochrome P450 [Actinomadura sp. WMMB 499]QFG25991.1 cytochrome P450 [Actinomadura sp. WMMB 499]